LTPLETNHAAFVTGQAHLARYVVGCRGLDTGVARDVSGVLSVRRGGCWDEGDDEGGSLGRSADGGDGSEGIKEMEVLYHVLSDGNVKVFERGGGDVG